MFYEQHVEPCGIAENNNIIETVEVGASICCRNSDLIATEVVELRRKQWGALFPIYGKIFMIITPESF